MPDTFFIHIRNNKVCVHTFGSGQQPLIAFHGFKEDGSHFLPLEESLGTGYTILAPDLPFHGNTEWKDPYFNMNDLSQLITEILRHTGSERFSLLGYSMGGRVALCAASLTIQRMDALVLLAPDGLKVNPWYYFVTQTRSGHAIFRYTTFHPGLLHLIIETGHYIHLTNESIYKFTRLHTDDLEQRVFVYKIWTCLRYLFPNIPAIKERIIRYKLPSAFFFGRFDRIITVSQSEQFKDLPSVKIKVLEHGHQLLNKEVADEIFRYLNQNKLSS